MSQRAGITGIHRYVKKKKAGAPEGGAQPVAAPPPAPAVSAAGDAAVSNLPAAEPWAEPSPLTKGAGGTRPGAATTFLTSDSEEDGGLRRGAGGDSPWSSSGAAADDTRHDEVDTASVVSFDGARFAESPESVGAAAAAAAELGAKERLQPRSGSIGEQPLQQLQRQLLLEQQQLQLQQQQQQQLQLQQQQQMLQEQQQLQQELRLTRQQEARQEQDIKVLVAELDLHKAELAAARHAELEHARRGETLREELQQSRRNSGSSVALGMPGQLRRLSAEASPEELDAELRAREELLSERRAVRSLAASNEALKRELDGARAEAVECEWRELAARREVQSLLAELARLTHVELHQVDVHQLRASAQRGELRAACAELADAQEQRALAASELREHEARRQRHMWEAAMRGPRPPSAEGSELAKSAAFLTRLGRRIHE